MISPPRLEVVRKLNYLGRKLKDGELRDLIRHHRRKRLMKRLLAGKTGLEVGGPSRTFTPIGEVPAYPYASRVDNTNFAQVTVWEGSITEGMTFQYDEAKPPGRQYVHDASDLHSIPTGTYDFLLASHTLEHVANPLRVLEEWQRVLTPTGVVAITLPHPSGTFDHLRATTPLTHLIDDYHRNVGEDDLTHVDEILRNHDLSRDPDAGDFESFQRRSLANFQHRCLHHHVFDTASAATLIDQAGLQILNVEAKRPMHIIIIARKVGPLATKNNRRFLDPRAKYRRISPFDRDRGTPSSRKSSPAAAPPSPPTRLPAAALSVSSLA